MRSTQQFSITLPNEMADVVKAKVAGGEYATESEVIREGLRALIAHDRAIEQWLHTEVTAAYDEIKADPSTALTVDQVRTSLVAARRRRATAQG
jgi:putative addiction module CopG family antidote